MKKYKFDIADILTIGLVLVVTGIALAVGLQIMGDIRSDIGDSDCAGYYNTATNVCQVSSTNTTTLSGATTAENATVSAIEGVAKLPEKMPLIATVVVAAIVIGILVRYLFVKLN